MGSGKTATFYDRLWARHRPAYEPSRRHLERFFTDDEVAGKTALDAGCGCGVFTAVFAEKGARRAVGVDISGGALDAAAALARDRGAARAGFARADMLRLPFADGTFDIVWAWGSVHHTENPLDALEELLRVLKPGGAMLLAMYRKDGLTFVHRCARAVLSRTPGALQPCAAAALAVPLRPLAALCGRREKMRGGETMTHLALDWFFVPVRHHFDPEEIRAFVERRGVAVEQEVPAAGRFDSTSNFIFKMRRTR